MSLRRVQPTVEVPVHELSSVASARRKARRLGEDVGLGKEYVGRLEIVVSEAATNLIRHAGHGKILLTAQAAEGEAWLEVLALDQGPGIRNLGRALAGGTSTGGGLGHGLGAIKRLADGFAIFAPPGRGTAVLARLGEPPLDGPCLVAGLSRPLPPHEVCGDGWGVRQISQERTLILVLDGVGHGPAASEAATCGMAVLARRSAPETIDLLEEVHEALKRTRGAAGLAILLDPESGEFQSVGVGNIQGVVVLAGERRKSVVSLAGTLGSGRPQFQQFSGEWPDGGVLVAHSDGVSSRWAPEDYAGLWSRDPGLIAGILFRDHAWDHDDATIVVAQCPDRMA